MAIASSKAKTRSRSRLVYPAYGLTIAFLALAYFFPGLRVWGLNFPAFLPWWAAVAMVAIVVIGPIAAHSIGKKPSDEQVSTGIWTSVVIGVTLIFGVLYWVFRTQTHFLGDGYQILSLLSSDQPFLKPFEYGTAWLHLVVYSVIDQGESAALASHRIVSIASGIVYVLGVGYLARMLFDTMRNRLLFLIGMTTAGLVLLFFGYVENYSLLILACLAFAIVGLAVTQGRIGRGWILIPLAAGLLFHILAITLIPAAVHLLLSETAVSRWFENQSRASKRLLGGAVVALLAIGGIGLYVNSLFLRLTVLPVFPHQLTVPGYSLLSPAHLIDFVNLMLLLMPGLLVLLAFVFGSGSRNRFQSRSMRFLGWMSLAALAAAFVFDPKLGMPRDWDLFAFASVPSLIIVFVLVLSSKSKSASSAVILSIALSIALLFSRVATQASTGPSLEYTKYIRDLDPVKSRNLWFVMIKYHRDRGELATALEMQEEWSRHFPELGLNQRAYEAYHQGRYLETIKLCRSIIDRNPTYADAWLNAGVAYRALKRTDSALYYLEVANALSPYTPAVYINLAMVMIDRGLLDRAERLLDEAIKTDSSFAGLYYQYARISRMQGDQPAYIKYLSHAASKSDTDPTYLRELTSAQLQVGDIRAARAAFHQAIDKGLDSISVDSMLREYPQLGH